MQLQVSFGMVGVYGCLWVFMVAEMHREFIEPAMNMQNARRIRLGFSHHKYHKFFIIIL